MEIEMSKYTRRKLIAFLFILFPFFLNILWSGSGPQWLYWTSRFLLPLEQVIIGILLIVIPRPLQRWVGSEPDVRITLLLMATGIFLGLVGARTLQQIAARWVVECSSIAACLY
jgi:hypothetical protein